MKNSNNYYFIFSLSILFNLQSIAQCNITTPNLFLDYNVSVCNGMTFQSAVGAVLNPFDECDSKFYTSVLVGPNEITKNEDASIVMLSIFPNPVIEKLNFNTADFQMISFRLIDAMGREISDLPNPEIQAGLVKIDVSELVPGCYIIQVVDKSKNRVVGKFIKSKI